MSIKLKGSSDGSVSFDAPADTSPSGSDITLTLPTSAGSANQFLKNSGIAGELEYSSMVETSTGVGIGTSSPESNRKLTVDIGTTSANVAVFKSQDTSGGSYIGFMDKDTTNGNRVRVGAINDDMAFITAGSEVARLDSSGNLRFPEQQDVVFGVDLNTSSGDGGDLTVKSGNGSGSGNDSGNLYLAAGRGGSSANSGFIAFGIAQTTNTSGLNVEYARLSNEGLLSVSTNTGDSDRYNSGGYHAIHSHKTNSIALAIEHSSGASPYGLLISFSDAAPDNNGNYYLKCNDSNTDRLIIWSDGDVDNHDNSYSGTSDVKLKQDIVDAGSQWDDIKDLRVRKFKFKSDVAAYGDEAKTLIGVVAQEIESVSPGLVKESPDVDGDGNDLGTTTKSVRYSVLYMKAVKALQEAQTRIETLETQNTAQQAQIDDLLARVTALEAA